MKSRSITFSACALTVLLFLAVSSFAQQTAVPSEAISTSVAKASSDERKMPSVDKVTAPSTTKTEKESADTSTDSSWSYTDDGKWHFEIRPYLWAAGLNGNLRVRDTTLPVKADFSDMFGHLNFAMASQFEVGKGRWKVIIDENYMNLGIEVRNSVGNVAFNVEPTLNILEAGASYRLVAQPHKTDADSRPPKFSAELLGGVRWIHMNTGITPAGGTEVEGTTNLTGFFVGNRYKFNVSRPITLVGKWTVGTSGVNSNIAGTAEAYADVRFAKNFGVTGGYRFMEIKADDLDNLTGFQGQMKGFFAGFVIYR